MNYKEYEKGIYEISQDIKNHKIYKKDYEILLKCEKIEKRYKEKIDKLALQYMQEFMKSYKIDENNFKNYNLQIIGYYEIIEYCLKKIKQNDKNLEYGFGTCANKK